MRRLDRTPRADWPARLAELGGDLAVQTSSPFWREDAAYAFTDAEVETLHDATVEIERIVREAVDHVVRRGRFSEIGIAPNLAELAALSWERQEPSLYGRYDLRFDGVGPPKLLEYNADTPTSLFEASIVQWHWLEACEPEADQFNSIHEALVDHWEGERREGRLSRVHFACFPDDDDDMLTTAYLLDTALQGGLDGELIQVVDIGSDGARFIDLEGRRIDALFKLYPWDWMAREPFFERIAPCGLKVLEPAWRVIASSKGLLAILAELYPGHENLLPASLAADRIPRPRVLKPIFGREGANVLIDLDGTAVPTDGPYADMATVAQVFAPLPDFDGWRPVIGAWVIGGEPHGIGIREERSLVTGRLARFVPHFIMPG